MEKHTKNVFDCILILFSILLIINIILYIKYPNGLLNYNGLNFLGIRTRFTDYAFPTIIISFYSLLMTKEKRYILPILISFINIIMGEISTAYTGIFVFILYYFIYSKKKTIKKAIGTKLFVYSFIITFLIVFARILDNINPLLQLLFEKTATLSGRTEIWDASIPVIKEHIIFGKGIINDGNFVPMHFWNGIMFRQSHNQTLQLLYDGGIISTAIFYFILFLSFKNTNKFFCDKKKMVFPIALFSLVIMMITEIYLYYPAPYLLIFICYFIDKFDYKFKKRRS